MAYTRVSMRKTREILRLHHSAALSNRAIARSLKLSASTVSECLARARAAKGFAIANELDLEPRLHRHTLGIVAYLIAQRLRPACVIEQAGIVVTEITRHGLRITDIRQRPSNHDTIEAGQYACDPVPVRLNEQIHRRGSMLNGSEERLEYDELLVPTMPG